MTYYLNNIVLMTINDVRNKKRRTLLNVSKNPASRLSRTPVLHNILKQYREFGNKDF